jgi:uncharacterized paraquat-inducible protein A
MNNAVHHSVCSCNVIYCARCGHKLNVIKQNRLQLHVYYLHFEAVVVVAVVYNLWLNIPLKITCSFDSLGGFEYIHF